MSWRNLASALALVGLGCTPQGPDSSEPALKQDALRPGTPLWAGVQPDDVVVARVNGIPIGGKTLEEAIRSSPHLSPPEVLQRLVELEALAQEAVNRGIGLTEAGHDARQHVLVQRYLKTDFEKQTTADQIPDADVKRVYALPQVRTIYDHADAWKMAHLFITCCDPKVEDCATEEVFECFEMGARVIHEIYSEVSPQTATVQGQPEALVERMEAYRLQEEARFPQLAYRDRAFYYDPAKSHEEQKGYNILAEVVARTVIDAPLAVLQEPVQSAFGWHILAKLDHIPEARKGPEDPEVAADIRENLFPKFRQARFVALLRQLKQQHGVVFESSPTVH